VTKDLYVVRAIEDRQLVCFVTVHPILGEVALSDYVDEFHTVKLCEYARLDEFSMGWPDKAPAYPDYFTSEEETNFETPPLLSEVMQDESDDLVWSRFGVGFVYFLRLNGRIKIGYSKNPKGRLITLQTSSPDRLEFIGCRPGSEEDEARLHEIYYDLRVSGEWFLDQGSLTHDLQRLKSHPDFQRDINAVGKPIRYDLDY
jgi:hypothetical protein